MFALVMSRSGNQPDREVASTPPVADELIVLRSCGCRDQQLFSDRLQHAGF
jgi:hypothetical protein